MSRIRLTPFQFIALHNPYQHFAFFAGIASGKSFTGSHFAIKMMTKHPELTGFIGANNYDQMSHATLREFYYWLTYYGFQYVADRRPPAEWGEPIKFKDYNNVMSVRNMSTGSVSYIFTRILSDADPLRGVEFSWYWLDESRDTPQMTHDVILSRMRESDIVKGLITTTTNGEDWTYQRFVIGNDGSDLYGSMHIPTSESLRYGIITQNFYNSLRKSYSPLMAMQELDALHVNTRGGRAYYAAGDHNRRTRAPWGDYHPNPQRPLIVGCDFNFNPAPCCWVVGQTGPDQHSDHVHWFGEIAHVEYGTREMVQALVGQYPGFFYQIYGDASGMRGTTSNAGDHDYMQMADELNRYGCLYSIDVNQNNPLVKNRIENMNSKFKNAIGEVTMTYDPARCPLFDGDVKIVGWKKLTASLSNQGRLDNNGDVQRTHATDAAGYAIWKLFPPNGSARMVEALPSSVRAESGLVMDRSSLTL